MAVPQVVSTPVQFASAVVGDAWSVLILREALLLGAERFLQFEKALQINKATLSNRLGRLVDARLLQRKSSDPSDEGVGYQPTAAAEAYVPVLLAMLQWGRDWATHPAETGLLDVRHTPCGTRLTSVLTCTTCNGYVDARAVRAERPDASTRRPQSRGRHRASQLDQLERGRACPIARCLATIGDRWSVLIVQEAFFGLRKFDEFQRRLGIAPNILSSRLNRLCGAGVLERRSPPGTQAREVYYLTRKGLELYPLPAMLRQWAINTLGAKEPLSFSHRWCGSTLTLELKCVHCGLSADHQSIAASAPAIASSPVSGIAGA